MVGVVARSFYKGESLGATPACAICVGKGRGRRAQLHLPGGVSVWLCEAHRDPEFLRSRACRDIVVSLMHVWRSAGCLTARRSQALTALRDQLLIAPRTPTRPGSYAWPTLRLEAERRFAAGEDPAVVIDDLRNREQDRSSPARPPSVRTMRRWFREGRWRGGRRHRRHTATATARATRRPGARSVSRCRVRGRGPGRSG